MMVCEALLPAVQLIASRSGFEFYKKIQQTELSDSVLQKDYYKYYKDTACDYTLGQSVVLCACKALRN